MSVVNKQGKLGKRIFLKKQIFTKNHYSLSNNLIIIGFILINFQKDTKNLTTLSLVYKKSIKMKRFVLESDK